MKKIYFLFTVLCFSASNSVLYAEDYDYLYERIYDDRGEKLSKAQVKSNLNQLADIIEGRYSYSQLNGVPYKEILNKMIDRVEDKISIRNLAIQLQQFISLFGDGHASILYNSGDRFISATGRPDGLLPFGIRKSKNHFVAIDSHKSSFFIEDYPYINSINRILIQDWMNEAHRFVANGSKVLKDFRALKIIHNINLMQRAMNKNKDKTKSFIVEFYNEQGEKIEKTINLGRDRHLRQLHPDKPILSIPDNISYLKIPHMDNDDNAIRKIKSWLEESRDKDGAIIDIRGNTGGRREPLQIIFPHIMDPDEMPYIATLAAYKLTSEDRLNQTDGYLSDRFLFPKSYQRWNENHILSINKFMENFNPKWQLPEQGFSDWHYNIMSPIDNPALFGKKLVILMDDANFSASDVFLGAFKGRENVTLIGVPSQGGSARAKTYGLFSRNIRVRLATIASFKRDGNIYDGNPTHPDIVIYPSPSYFIGESDEILSKALEVLATS